METKQELLTLNGKEYLLDIKTAKQLGLLKEKDSRVKSWDEFKEKYSGSKGYYWSSYYNNLEETGLLLTNEQLTPREAKALAAFSKLLKLRRDWIVKWEPDWLDPSDKFIFYRLGNDVSIYTSHHSAANGLSFPTKQMAREFLETFRDLIEEAKILI
jgi:hypothetical protein